MTSLSPRLRRLVALSLLAALLLAVYNVAIGPLLDSYSNNRRSIDELQNAESRYAELAREAPDLQKQLEALRRESAATAGYLEGQNETIIAATLQDRLKAAVGQTGGQLKSTQVLANAENAKSRKVSVRGNMALSLAALQRVLYDLESGSPYLFVDNLDVRPATNPRASGQSEGDGPLDVSFDIYGYLRGNAS
jgi:general secretion pathway protein M